MYFNLVTNKTDFMKAKILITVFVILALTSFGQVTNQLEACYSLAGNANDPINGLNGTLGAVTPDLDRNNNPNESYNFSGSLASIITLPDDPRLKDNAMSVSAWVRPSVINGSYIVFAKNNFSAFHEAYALSMDGVKFVAAKCNSNGNFYQYSTTIPAPNTWYHLVITVNKTSLSLYVNGVLESTGSSSGNIEYEVGKNVQLGGSGESYFPGAFQGNIDNVRFYSRILTAQDVSDLYTLDPTCSSGPIGGPGPGPGPTPVNGASCLTGAKSWNQGGNITPPDNRLGTCSPTDLVFMTNSNNHVWLKSDGKLGVGTSSPNHPFEVSGDSRFLNRIYAGSAKVLQLATVNVYNNTGHGGLWSKTDHSTINNSYNSVFEINNPTTKALSVVNTNFPASTSLAFKEFFTVYGNGDTYTDGTAEVNNQLKVINPAFGPSGRIFAGKGISVKGLGVLNSYDNTGQIGLWLESALPSANSYNAVFAASHNDAKSITVLDLNTLTGLAPFNYKPTFSVLCDGRTQLNTRSTNFIEAFTVGRELTPNNYDKNIVLYNNGAGHFSNCVQIGFPNGTIPSPNEALYIEAGIKTGIISRTKQPSVIGGYNVHIQVDNNLTKALAVGCTDGGPAETFLVNGNGSTGIGTNFIPSGFKLAVAGGGTKININSSATGSSAGSAIEVDDLTGTNFKVKSSGFVYARSIEVTLANFPDYVFSNNYKLMTLAEVEAYIKKNHHLPNVPSAIEVEKNGANLGELARIQMEKIEELTLYIIELKKQMDELQKQTKAENKQ